MNYNDATLHYFDASVDDEYALVKFLRQLD